MLNEEIQKKLAKRYGGEPLQKMVKEAFDKERVVKSLHEPFAMETEAVSAIVFMDIAGFSGKVAGMNAAQTRDFLDGFYSVAIPRIYKHRGHIDRIIGDGILAVYSGHLSPDLTLSTTQTEAMNAAESVIMRLHGTDHECKAAMSVGKVLYCRTGLAEVYEDYTIIGQPLTVAYRIEEAIKANQFAVPKLSQAGQTIVDQVADYRKRTQQRSALGFAPEPVNWNVDFPTVPLRGIGDTVLALQTYNPPE